MQQQVGGIIPLMVFNNTLNVTWQQMPHRIPHNSFIKEMMNSFFHYSFLIKLFMVVALPRSSIIDTQQANIHDNSYVKSNPFKVTLEQYYSNVQCIHRYTIACTPFHFQLNVKMLGNISILTQHQYNLRKGTLSIYI